MVFDSNGIDHQLLNHGEIPNGWIDRYFVELEGFHKNHVNSMVWDKKAFQAIHYASIYLPIRLSSWSRISESNNRDLFDSLSVVSIRSELVLWQSGCEDYAFMPSKSKSTLNADDLELIELAFEYPKLFMESHYLVNDSVSWKQKYELALERVSDRWTKQLYWPKWLVLAIRFASFYMDTWQKYNTYSDRKKILSDERFAIQDEMEMLQNRLLRTDVPLVIKNWLNKCHLERGNDGLPIAKEHEDLNDIYLSVRTLSEIFLLNGISFSNDDCFD